MIWKKKKDASAEAAETTEAKSGVSAFAKKNWKWARAGWSSWRQRALSFS